MDVVVWLRSLGLGRYEAAFRENAIDETVLPSLTAEDLKELGVTALGHRRKLLDAITALRSDASGKASSADVLTNQRIPIHSLARSDPKSLFRRTYNPLRVGDCLAINLRPHDRSERRLRADKPSEDIHQLRDLRRSIEIHHHENLAACWIAINGLRTEPLHDLSNHRTGPFS